VRAPSLFVVSLPRSLSSLVYRESRRALGLQRPRWTEAGEILNLARYVLMPRQNRIEGFKYTQDRDQPLFDAVVDFLDQTVQPTGFAYKDVVQIFAVCRWLPRSPCRVLRIERSVPDVALAMLSRGWIYPASSATEGREPIKAVIEGLHQAEVRLRALDAVTVRYDDLVASEEPLYRALHELYPGHPLRHRRYRDEDFEHKRKQVMERRRSSDYATIRRLYDQVVSEQGPAGRG